MRVNEIIFQQLFEATPHPYLILNADENYTIFAVNDYYLAATGIQRNEVIGKPLFEVFPDDPNDVSTSSVSDLHISLDRVVRTGQTDIMGVQKYDIPLRDGSGKFEIKYWSPVNVPIVGENGNIEYIIHHVEDVTEYILLKQKKSSAESTTIKTQHLESEILKRANEVKEINRELKAREEELAALNDKLTELDRIKTTFFSNVSHEFRTPLTLLLAPIEEILAAHKDEQCEKITASLKIAHRNALRLLKLVNSLLDFSKVEAGRAKAAWEATDLSAYTADLASNFSSACELGNVKLIVDCPPLPSWVKLDRDMWEKIVLNLISNAFKFTHEGTIRVQVRTEGTLAKLIVQDTGIGIAKEELPKIFDRFYRIEGAHGRSYEGSGIGLSLAYELVKLMGGAVEVQSEVGVGTTFTVSIPLGTKESETAEYNTKNNKLSIHRIAPYVNEVQQLSISTAQEPNLKRHKNDKGRIVVADDNADMRDYIRRLLEDADYRVETAVDGEEALLICKNDLPDLILSDVMMPRLNGFGLVAALRSDVNTAILPIILISARAGDDATLNGFQAGADDYLIKPFHASELVARVEGAVKLGKLRKKAEEKIQHERDFISAILDISSALIIVLARDGKIVHFNKMCEHVSGYSTEEAVGSMLWHDLIPSDEIEGAKSVFENLQAGNFPNTFENSWTSKKGELIRIRWSNTVMCDLEGKVEFIIATGIDITQSKANELKLQLAARVLENISEGVMTTTPDGNIISVNPAFSEITGFSQEELIGKNPRVIKSNKHNTLFYEKLWNMITSGSFYQEEIWNRRKSGDVFLVKETISPIKNENSEIINYVVVLTDITESKAKQELIEHQAYHDLLTGLPNRLLFADRLEQEIKLSKRNNSIAAVMRRFRKNFWRYQRVCIANKRCFPRCQ